MTRAAANGVRAIQHVKGSDDNRDRDQRRTLSLKFFSLFSLSPTSSLDHSITLGVRHTKGRGVGKDRTF